MNENGIDKLFKQKLEGLETEVPRESWSAIENSLPGGNIRRIIPMWMKYSAAVILLLTIGSLFFLKNNYQGKSHITAIRNEKKLLRKTTITQTEYSSSRSPHLRKAVNNTYPASLKVSKEELIQTSLSDDTSAYALLQENKESQEQSTNQPDTTTTSPDVSTPLGINEATIRDILELTYNSIENETANKLNHKRSGKRSKNSIGLSALLANSSDNNQNGLYNSFRSSSENNNVYMALTHSEQSTGVKNIKHFIPIKLGISVEKEISRNLFLETGIRGSYLKSIQNHSIQDNNTVLYFADEIQELYYLGIPLGIAYRFAESERFSFYVKGETAIDKNIAGRWRERISRNNEVIYTKLERDLENKLQWSGSIGTGVNYNLSGIMNIYFEPALSYYPDNHSNIENIYKQKKFDISVQAGIRAIFESH